MYGARAGLEGRSRKGIKAQHEEARRAKNWSTREGHTFTSPAVWILPSPLNFQGKGRRARGQKRS